MQCGNFFFFVGWCQTTQQCLAGKSNGPYCASCANYLWNNCHSMSPVVSLLPFQLFFFFYFNAFLNSLWCWTHCRQFPLVRTENIRKSGQLWLIPLSKLVNCNEPRYVLYISIIFFSHLYFCVINISYFFFPLIFFIFR